MSNAESAQDITEPPRQTPVVNAADVVCVGGGPGGVPAAIAAARGGARVLIIERYGFLGGLATAGQIGPLFGFNTAQTDELMLGSIPVEVVEELQGLGGAPQPDDMDWRRIPFEPELMKHALDRLVAGEPNIRLLLHTIVVGVVRDGARIDCVLVENKSGRGAIRGKVFLDATGDGDVAALAGCPYTKGRHADGAMQSMGTKIRIGGIRETSKDERQESVRIFKQAIADKRVPAYHPFVGELSESGITLRTTEETPTCTRARGDGTDVNDLTRNELKLRADTLEIVEFARQNIPGFANCYLMSTPAQIGVRETRQITGHHVLTGNECLAVAKFDDGIARGSWFLDIHCPLGLTSPDSSLCSKNCKVQPDCIMKRKYPDQLYDTVILENGSYYEIPYGCLTPQGADNLLVAGRCISADHGAMSSLRVMGTCMAIGEAAGAAAAMCLHADCAPSELAGGEVREALTQAGVPL